MEIVVDPGSLAPRNYHGWQKLFVKNHVRELKRFSKIHALLLQIDNNKGFKGVFSLLFSKKCYKKADDNAKKSRIFTESFRGLAQAPRKARIICRSATAMDGHLPSLGWSPTNPRALQGL